MSTNVNRRLTKVKTHTKFHGVSADDFASYVRTGTMTDMWVYNKTTVYFEFQRTLLASIHVCSDGRIGFGVWEKEEDDTPFAK